MSLRRFAVLALAAVVLSGCTSTARSRVAEATTSVPSANAPTSGVALTTITAAGTSALVASLPAGCGGGLPAAGAVLTFVAGGRAWALAPGSASSLRCLFPVSNPGVWSWGPQGDRVLLDGLAVRGVGSPLSRPAGNYDPSYFSWSRPTGTTVVYTGQAQNDIRRADMGYGGSADITPIAGATYGDMAYHPSGLAIGFVAAPGGAPQSIWMSTNMGKNPQQLVSGGPGTTFGHIVFAHDGIGLYYGVDTSAGAHTLARYDLPSGAVEQALWSGPSPIDDITEVAGVVGVALTVGAQCADRRAVFSSLDGSAGHPLSPGVPGPALVVGSLDADRFVVAVGGCGGQLSDLYLVHRSSAPPTLLVRGVSAGAMRTPEPTPPPPLPQNLPRSAFG